MIIKSWAFNPSLDNHGFITQIVQLKMKRFIPIIFLSVLLIIITTANIYLTGKFTDWFHLETNWWLYLLFGVSTVYMIAGTMGFSNATSKLGSFAYMLASFLMGFMLYMLISLIVVDLASLLIKTNTIYYGLAVIVLSIGISVYGIYNSFNTKIIEQNITLSKLDNDLKIIHLSDIHIGHYRGKKFLKNIVDKTNAENPDLVVITGDLYDGRIRLNLENLLPLKKMNAPIYFVEGNHDNYTGVQEIKAMLRSMGVKVLENESVVYKGVEIIGLNHLPADNKTFSMHAQQGKTSIKSVLENYKSVNGHPKILLHHSPDGIKYASDAGIDLYLSGHTHAGQIWPITHIANLIFQFNKGLHKFENTLIYVSQGAGTFGPPMRVGTDSEITLLNLKPLEN